jgi:histidine ammonia-lyase
LSASQAVDLLRPLELGGVLKTIYQTLRKSVPFADKDRVFSKDVQKVREIITGDAVLQVCRASFGSLEF